MSLAVVGPDGAGKTTYIRDVLELPGRNPVEYTKRLPMKRDRAYRLAHELLMGMEKALNYIKWHITGTDGVVLDRCFIDAEVYATLWSVQEDTWMPLRIARFFNLIAYEPDTIIQLYPDPHSARPKRKYLPEEIRLLNELFTLTLINKGYDLFGKPHDYAFGEVRIWKKATSS